MHEQMSVRTCGCTATRRTAIPSGGPRCRSQARRQTFLAPFADAKTVRVIPFSKSVAASLGGAEAGDWGSTVLTPARVNTAQNAGGTLAKPSPASRGLSRGRTARVANSITGSALSTAVDHRSAEGADDLSAPCTAGLAGPSSRVPNHGYRSGLAGLTGRPPRSRCPGRSRASQRRGPCRAVARAAEGGGHDSSPRRARTARPTAPA